MDGVVALTGKDVIKINDRLLNDLMDGDVASLVFPNDTVVAKTGKNGNTIFSFKYDGKVCNFTLRVVRGSGDDKFLNNLFNLLNNDPAAFSLMSGEFAKQIGDGSGNITQDIYILSGGIFKKAPEGKENADGETDQAVTVWELIFTNAPRSIG
jgi:hypothetical protein